MITRPGQMPGLRRDLLTSLAAVAGLATRPSYIKGPDAAPFLPSETVFVWRR